MTFSTRTIDTSSLLARGHLRTAISPAVRLFSWRPVTSLAGALATRAYQAEMRGRTGRMPLYEGVIESGQSPRASTLSREAMGPWNKSKFVKNFADVPHVDPFAVGETVSAESTQGQRGFYAANGEC